MEAPPFPVSRELPGWELAWIRLEAWGPEEPASAPSGANHAQPVAASAPQGPGPSPAGVEDRLAALRRELSELARATFEGADLPSHATVAAVRKLFRAAGCDPTRYRPSSEALLRRLLKGEDLPAIHPLVDLNNCLSVELAVPCSLLAEGRFTPPVVLRAGRPGEAFESLRGPFNLEGKPLLADARGPLGTPITDGERAKVREGTQAAWLVAYLPAGQVSDAAVRAKLGELLARAPVARVTEG